MRLICPNCNAQYDIDQELIPTEGRDVECSSCSKVWFQPKDQPLAAAPHPLAADGSTMPAPSRQLNESVLAVLREEAARELRARKADRAEAIESTQIGVEGTAPAGPSGRPQTHLPATPTPSPTKTEPASGRSKDQINLVPHPTPAPAIPATQDTTDPAQIISQQDGPIPQVDGDSQPATLQPVDKNVIPPPPAAGRYAAGFILALAVIGALAGAYLAAPKLPQDSSLGQIATGLRTTADHGRIWLHHRLSGGVTD